MVAAAVAAGQVGKTVSVKKGRRDLIRIIAADFFQRPFEHLHGQSEAPTGSASGITVRLILEGYWASWCTALCAITP